MRSRVGWATVHSATGRSQIRRELAALCPGDGRYPGSICAEIFTYVTAWGLGRAGRLAVPSAIFLGMSLNGGLPKVGVLLPYLSGPNLLGQVY